MLDPEYIKYLKNEIIEFDKELASMVELPSVKKLRDNIKKDKRDTQGMLRLYERILRCKNRQRHNRREIMRKKTIPDTFLYDLRMFLNDNYINLIMFFQKESLVPNLSYHKI